MTTLPFANSVNTHLNIVSAQSADYATKSVNTHSARTLGTVLLAAVVSALLVVVNQALDAWSEDHLLMAWVALWAIGFLAMGLLATPAHRAARSLRASFAQWRIENKEADEEARMWEIAKYDPRIMADIQAAMARSAN
jgi:hypothetical protein